MPMEDIMSLDHGDGIHLYDVNQKEYIDFFSGIGVILLAIIIQLM